jgi:tetratricopeptide (TPR) repeat protein
MQRSLMLLFFITLFLSGCDAEKKSRKEIEVLQSGGNKYEVGIACMRYISHQGEDLVYSRTLVKKLLDIRFYAEAINAVDLLLTRFPSDAELFFLRGVGYRSQHQYALAFQNLVHALELQPDNSAFKAELARTRELEKHWNEIQSLNESLEGQVDSFNILLKRAEKFFELQLYDAVVYDLGAISKMGAAADSLYFTQKVTAMYKESDGRPVEKLSEILDYFRGGRMK